MIYEGEFKDDKFNGIGKYFYDKGDTYEGDFLNGEFHGQGKYVFEDGSLFHDGLWENGNPINN